jgi:predicted DNA-binding transcriptional regulator AlpA
MPKSKKPGYEQLKTSLSSNLSSKKRNVARAEKGVRSSYTPAYASLARKMMMNGATTTEVAAALQVSVPTLYTWMHNHTEFANAFKLGGPVADSRVEISLYEKAVGYKWQEEVKTKEFDEQGNEIEKVTTVNKQMPPDNSSMFFYLKNRRPNRWKDKVEINVSHNLAIVSDAELYQLIADNRAIETEYEEVKSPDEIEEVKKIESTTDKDSNEN